MHHFLVYSTHMLLRLLVIERCALMADHVYQLSQKIFVYVRRNGTEMTAQVSVQSSREMLKGYSHIRLCEAQKTFLNCCV